MILLAFLPPLWRAVMHPRLLAHRRQQLGQKFRHGPTPEPMAAFESRESSQARRQTLSRRAGIAGLGLDHGLIARGQAEGKHALAHSACCGGNHLGVIASSQEACTGAMDSLSLSLFLSLSLYLFLSWATSMSSL